MKKILTLVLLLSSFALQSSAQLSSGLLAHWDFSGNTNDISGNGHNGTATNISYATGRNGGSNTAAYFSGLGSYIHIPYHSTFNMNKHSLAAYVKFDKFYTGLCQVSVIIQRGDHIASGCWNMRVMDNPFDSSCAVTGNTNKFVFTGGAGQNTGTIPHKLAQTNPTLQVNKWYCAVVTFDGDFIRMYVDGKLLSTTYGKQPLSPVGTSTDFAIIGANRFNTPSVYSMYPYWFYGLMDDVRVYNRALSHEEVITYCGLFDTAVMIKNTTKLTLCNDETFNLPYAAIPGFNAGNVFTAELSDPLGSFANPVSIGSVTSSVDGQITCTIPPTATPGIGYKVRIVSTNPVRITELTLPVEIHNNQLPSITITRTPPGILQLNQTVTYVATPLNAGTNPLIYWFRNGTQIPNAFDDTLVINTLNDGDTVYAQVVSNKPCALDITANSNVDTVEVASSVISMKLHNLSVYPNPGKGVIHITASEVAAPQLHTSIYNAAGQLIFSETVNIDNQKLDKSINMGGKPSGVYLLRISYNGRQENIRLTIID